MPTREKYSTRAAEWYRQNLKALAEGADPPSPLPTGTGHLPASGCHRSSIEKQVLDQVFANVPKRGSMTSGGVLRSGSVGMTKSRTWPTDKTFFAGSASKTLDCPRPPSSGLWYKPGKQQQRDAESSLEAERGADPKRSRTMSADDALSCHNSESALSTW